MCNAIGNVFRLVIVGALACALAFSFVTTFNCDFLNFGGFDIASLGLWYYGIGGECQTTKFEAADDGLIAGARSCITISMICGAGSMFLITFEWLCCEICCAGILEGIGIACAWIFGAMTFMVYGLDICDSSSPWSETIPGFPELTDGDICEWGSGSSWLTAAIICYLGCGCLLCFTPQPDPICKKSG